MLGLKVRQALASTTGDKNRNSKEEGTGAAAKAATVVGQGAGGDKRAMTSPYEVTTGGAGACVTEAGASEEKHLSIEA